jgi:hypothetical protein
LAFHDPAVPGRGGKMIETLQQFSSQHRRWEKPLAEANEIFAHYLDA